MTTELSVFRRRNLGPSPFSSEGLIPWRNEGDCRLCDRNARYDYTVCIGRLYKPPTGAPWVPLCREHRKKFLGSNEGLARFYNATVGMFEGSLREVLEVGEFEDELLSPEDIERED